MLSHHIISVTVSLCDLVNYVIMTPNKRILRCTFSYYFRLMQYLCTFLRPNVLVRFYTDSFTCNVCPNATQYVCFMSLLSLPVTGTLIVVSACILSVCACVPVRPVQHWY